MVSLHLLLPEGLRSDLPAVDRTFADFRGGGRDEATSPAAGGKGAVSEFRGDRTRTVDDLVAGIRRRPGRPGLHFLHAEFPHVPWQYLPSGQQYLSGGPDTPGLEGEQWSEQAFPARLGMQRHLLQLGYTDRLVGRVLARLRGARLLDRALVIFTADHGVSFRPGRSRRAIVRENRSDIAAVPLFIKYPRQRRGRIDTLDGPQRGHRPDHRGAAGSAAQLGRGRPPHPPRRAPPRPGRGVRPAVGAVRRVLLRRLRPRADRRPQADDRAVRRRRRRQRASMRPAPTAICWGSRWPASGSVVDPPAGSTWTAPSCWPDSGPAPRRSPAS